MSPNRESATEAALDKGEVPSEAGLEVDEQANFLMALVFVIESVEIKGREASRVESVAASQAQLCQSEVVALDDFIQSVNDCFEIRRS
jgi:hypothetical protein